MGRVATTLGGVLVVVAAIGTVARAEPACVPLRGGVAAVGNQDAIARLLASSETCPRDVFTLRALIRERGGAIATAFVGNRGFHNPSLGSFSLFEMASGPLAPGVTVEDGELFIGHFTAASGPSLTLDQRPSAGSLMIEAIAWDTGKGLFNFYELRGNGTTGVWTYKGDSGDIVADVAMLHRGRGVGQAAFGSRLRCSGCHVGGGPIMKELSAPHNDWWSPARTLPLGGRRFDERLAAIAEGFVGADRFASSVRAGLARLDASPQFAALRSGRTLQERLRPLFCPLEVNLESDPVALDETNATTTIPSGLLVDPRLAEARLETSRSLYVAALQATGSSFPETSRRDADHAWLGPVKATSDQLAVQALIAAGLVDAEFVSDVLAVDFTNPALSSARCGLLGLVPATASGDWPARFRRALAASSDPAGKALLANLTDPARTAEAHRRRAGEMLAACRAKLEAQPFVVSMLRLVAKRRAEVRSSEISSNPDGQILEPGFRVVFPRQAGPAAPELTLSDSCDVTP